MKKKNQSGILVYIEHDEKGVARVSLEILGEAGRLSELTGEAVYGIAIGKSSEVLKEQLKGYALRKLYVYESDSFFQAEQYEKMLDECIMELQPSIVLIGGTMKGRAFASRAAVFFRTGITADCTEFSIDEENNLIQIRPAFGGNLMAEILTPETRPQIATVREGIFQKSIQNAGEVPDFVVRQPTGERAAVVLHREKQKKETSITGQKILVAAGRGVKRKEDLEMLRELAGLLGGKLAASRALVEKGWMNQREQIGLSGNSVSPVCILTFGISGSVQFMAGMRTAAHIIAVNSDPAARIFEIAHDPICADLYEVVPELLWKLRDR